MGMQQHWGQQQAYMNGGYYDQVSMLWNIFFFFNDEKDQ
jgi:hypothetical protein